MMARRTPWWYYTIACLLGVVFGAAVVKVDEGTGLSLVGAPWIVAIALIVLGMVVLLLTLQVHQYAITDPQKRKSWVNPTKAVYALVSAKALGLAGAALGGWYLGQLLLCLPHFEASYYRKVIIQCAVTALVSLADMAVGIIGEWLCQLPPSEGPENPNTKRRRRKSPSVAAGSL
jgi:DMSO reductase anchor subunit